MGFLRKRNRQLPEHLWKLGKEKAMPKAYWRGRRIYDIGEFCAGWVKIAFYDSASYFTGTGACWVDMDEVTVEETEE